MAWIFPWFSHSKNPQFWAPIHPILRGLQSWTRWGVDGEAAINHIDISFRLSTRTAELPSPKFMQWQAIGTKPDGDKERQFLCNAVLGAQDASNAKRSTCHRSILSRTDVNDWTDSSVRSVELNGSFFGSRDFPVFARSCYRWWPLLRGSSSQAFARGLARSIAWCRKETQILNMERCWNDTLTPETQTLRDFECISHGIPFFFAWAHINLEGQSFTLDTFTFLSQGNCCSIIKGQNDTRVKVDFATQKRKFSKTHQIS